MNKIESVEAPKSVGAMVWTGRVITGLMGLAFLMSAVMKLTGGPDVAKQLEPMGLTVSMLLPLAILETVCVVIYLIPQTAVLGAILLTGYMGGAICTHWRVGEMFVPQILIGVLVWLGIYLREPKLRAILPIRRTRN
ncbi:MAG: DoxX family protein [Pirellulaceae bacterium]